MPAVEKDSKHHEAEDFEEDDLPAVPVVMTPEGPMPLPVAPPPPVPDRHPDNFICLRGPCRHYWKLVTMAGEGNPVGTFQVVKKQIHHTCLINPGFETSFADDNAYECNLWDPTTPDQLVALSRRREDYFKQHPEHRENEDARDEE